jgi:hypothetical protein
MAAAEAATQLANRDINFFDPPKDLMGGDIQIERRSGTLSLSQRTENTQRYNNLRNCMHDMLYNGLAFPQGWTPVGDTKAALIDRLIGTAAQQGTLYEYWNNRNNRIDIVRLSSVSGNDPRLNNLFVSQDSGPTDFVTDPIFLITPGVILDTADKTKTGNVENIVDAFQTLGDIYITSLGLNNIIAAGGVTLRRYGMGAMTPALDNGAPQDAAYKLTMNLYNNFSNTDPGEITLFTQYFRADYEPTPNSGLDASYASLTNNSAYFLGNPRKNPWINRNSTDTRRPLNGQENYTTSKRQIELFLLMKLFGDTFQVEYLNSIINSGPDLRTRRNKLIGRGNTVVLTVDKVVLLRCLINKVGCIHTNNTTKITSWYIPRFATLDELAAINKKAIITVADQTVSHNLSMINTLRAVRDFQPVNGLYINGYSFAAWTDPKRALFIEFLIDTIKLLEAKNNEINSYILSLSDFSIAKEYAARHKFKDIFVKYKDQYYKTLNNVRFIIETTIDNNITRNYAFNARALGDPGNYTGGLPALKTVIGTNTWDAVIQRIAAAAVGIQSGGVFDRITSIINDRARSILAGAAAAGAGLGAALTIGGIAPVALPLGVMGVLGTLVVNAFIIPQITLRKYPIPDHVIQKAADDTAASDQPAQAQVPAAQVDRPLNEIYRGRKYHTNLLWRTFQENVRGVRLNALSDYFLYCFVRDFIPEIFDYGRHMKYALGIIHGGQPIGTPIGGRYPNGYDLSPTIISDFLRPPEDGSPVYKYFPTFAIIPLVDAEVHDTGNNQTELMRGLPPPGTDLNRMTHEYIQYAHLFISTFPVFSTPLLREFFSKYGNAEAGIASQFEITLYEGPPPDNATATQAERVRAATAREIALSHISQLQPPQGGGGQFDSLSDFEKAATIAIDLYNEYYMCRLRESYCLEDGEKDLIRYKLLTIKGYIEMLTKEPDELLEKELEYLLKDLASMPAVIAKLPEADEIIKKIQEKSSVSRSNTVPLAQQASVSQVVKQNKGFTVSPSSLRFRRKGQKPIGSTRRRLPNSGRKLGLTRRLSFSRVPIGFNRPEGGRRGRHTRKRQHKNRKTKKRV